MFLLQFIELKSTLYSLQCITSRLLDFYMRFFVVIFRYYSLTETVTKFKSPFGGLIILTNPSGNNTIRFKLTNVVKAPRYDHMDSANSLAKWPER